MPAVAYDELFGNFLLYKPPTIIGVFTALARELLT